jgi:hypothetical protein
MAREATAGAIKLLAPVLPRTDDDAAGFDQRAKVKGEHRLVQGREPPEIPLAYLARIAQARQQRVPGRSQADAAQLLVVYHTGQSYARGVARDAGRAGPASPDP